MLSNWERLEGIHRGDPYATKIDLVRDGRRRFWDLFRLEIGHYITGQPLADVIPLLRCLIDKQWAADGGLHDDPPPEDIASNVISLLHYAHDRAREVEELRCRLREMHAQLLCLTGGHA
jgi:hypothetical protein